MKIGILSDTHIGLARDAFRDEVKKNYKKAIETLKDCDIVIHAGDIFDRNIIDATMLTTLLEPIKTYDLRIFYILGNHDIMRSNLEPSIDKYTRLKGEQKWFISGQDNERIRIYQDEIVNIVGIDYDDRYPKERLELARTRLSKSKINILVIHQDLADILNDEYPVNSGYLLNLGFDLVIDGHIHKYMVKTENGRTLLVPGATAITTFDKEDMSNQKYVHIFNTNSRELTPISIPDQTVGHYLEIDGVGKSQEEVHREIVDLTEKHKDEFIKIILKIDKPISLGNIIDNPKISVERQMINKDTGEIKELRLMNIDEEIKKGWNYVYSYEDLIRIIDDPELEDVEKKVEALINIKSNNNI